MGVAPDSYLGQELSNALVGVQFDEILVFVKKIWFFAILGVSGDSVVHEICAMIVCRNDVSTLRVLISFIGRFVDWFDPTQPWRLGGCRPPEPFLNFFCNLPHVRKPKKG